MKKKILSLVLVVCFVIPVIMFAGCNSKKSSDSSIEFNYSTFTAYENGTSTMNGLLTARWYKYTVDFTINNKTEENIVIYANNFMAEVIIDGDIENNLSIGLYDQVTENNLGDSITIKAGAELNIMGVINGKINMLNNAQRKINIYYNQELKFSFIPII